MKARIFEIKRFAVHDGDGIRTTVFFKGCPLKCAWCHNPEGISPQAELAYFAHKCIACGECLSVCPTGAHTLENGVHQFHRDCCIACGRCAEVCVGNALTLYGEGKTVEELLPELLQDQEFYQNSGGGVTLSGGECLLQVDACVALLKALKKNGVHTAVDTCGFVPRKALEKVIPYTDIFLYDIKAFEGKTHKAGTGKSNQKILENLTFLDDMGCKIEIRIPLVPGYNDEEIDAIAKFVHSLKNITKVEILPYHNLAGSKYQALGLQNKMTARIPTEKEVFAAKEKFIK